MLLNTQGCRTKKVTSRVYLIYRDICELRKQISILKEGNNGY